MLFPTPIFGQQLFGQKGCLDQPLAPFVSLRRPWVLGLMNTHFLLLLSVSLLTHRPAGLTANKRTLANC